MKKLILIVALLLGTLAMQGERLTSKQVQLRSNVFQFLKEEGFMPKVSDNSNITFKSEGQYFIVLFDERDTYPYYAEICLTDNYSEKYTIDAVKRCLPSLNFMRAVNTVCFDDYIKMAVQIYFTDIEQVKHTLYIALSQLKTTEEKLIKLIDEGESSQGTSNTNDNYRRLSYNDMFPVYGFYLNHTQNNFINNGHKIKKLDSGSSYFTIDKNQFWDFNKDGIYEALSLEKVPDEWSKYGFKMSWSYDQWKAYMEKQGFTITIYKGNEPKTKEVNGRNVLYAKFTAESITGGLEFSFYFDEGNQNGEGYSTSSSNSLSYVNIKKL
ncbi:MAG: hypothetical protein PHR45_06540 [Muribaculaceae bacterium]|nr:hypothetical protein [Muribaculaceae bacterium]